MRFLYLTDFHGDKEAYDAAFRLALSSGCRAIVNAGDALPKDAEFDFALEQRRFFETWLLPRLARLAFEGVRSYMMFGNDDARGIITVLDEAEKSGIVTRLDGEEWRALGDYWIIGFPYVPDYPFRLKDWCHGDTKREPCPVQLGAPLGTDGRHFVPYERSWLEELENRPTLDELLADLPRPPDPKRAIFCMHAPPYGVGLDVCSDRRLAGSVAGRDHILDRRYLLSLHGHIHESPFVTGRWSSKLGDTICVQPGALPRAHVIVDLESGLITHPRFGTVALPTVRR